ncbi:hypothetical protein ACQY0O_001826 [Thecaphora frezii]
MSATSSAAPRYTLTLRRHPADAPIPSHHVLAPPPGATLASYQPHWNAVHLSSSHVASSDADAQDSGSGASTTFLDACLALGGGGAPSSSLQNATTDGVAAVRTGFRNPWRSAAKPTAMQVWNALQWGEDTDPAIGVAMQLAERVQSKGGYRDDEGQNDGRDGEDDNDDREDDDGDGQQRRLFDPPWQLTTSAPLEAQARAAASLLHAVTPDFSFAPGQKSKTTWLGHASALVQLAPLVSASSTSSSSSSSAAAAAAEPVRLLFDPIFSMRCSPTQAAGPLRYHPPPCRVSDLPRIDVVLISHNHYDHLDWETVLELWRRDRERIRFLVPLGNRQWFVDAFRGVEQAEGLSQTATAATAAAGGGWEENVVELDWWETVSLTVQGNGAEAGTEARTGLGLEMTCTPAQHGSGRCGLDANVTLWSSWYIHHRAAHHRVFFAGDTGFQTHADPRFPPAPPSSLAFTRYSSSWPQGRVDEIDADADAAGFPPSPIFAEIRKRLGRPNVVLVPISVGATLSFVSTLVPVPKGYNPVPRLSEGITGANHTGPWDAVRIFEILTKPESSDEAQQEQEEAEEAVGMAVHWGTFVTGPEEILKSIGRALWACHCRKVECNVAGFRATHHSATESAGSVATKASFHLVHVGGSVGL